MFNFDILISLIICFEILENYGIKNNKYLQKFRLIIKKIELKIVICNLLKKKYFNLEKRVDGKNYFVN